jgi:hypothetical protein
VRRAIAVTLCVALAVVLVFELAAREAYRGAMQAVSREQLIERQQYAEAAAYFEAVASRYPYTTTAWLDVPARVAALRAKPGAPTD